jgi:glutathione S-transferase
VPAVLSPVAPSAAVNAANPVGKIPALVLEDGTALFDSRVIVEFLDALGGNRLIPPAGPARWVALRRAAEADGMLDALILVRYERMLRPPEKQFDAWVDGQMAKALRTLDALEAEAGELGEAGLAEIGIGCALGYLDFRFGDLGWRDTHPALTRFQARFAARPSMQATQPS